MSKRKDRTEEGSKSRDSKQCTCVKCGGEWLKRVENPRECPHCKSRNWKGKAV